MTLPYLIDCIGWTLLHFLWQGMLVGCVTALLLTTLRNARQWHATTLPAPDCWSV